jgi:uncharacterized protein (DUF2267 family)
MGNRRGVLVLSLGALLCTGLLSFVFPTADGDPRLGRAKEELQILFENRVELLLIDARRTLDATLAEDGAAAGPASCLSDDEADRFLDMANDVIKAFWEANPPKVGVSPNERFGEASPIVYEPFRNFLNSEEWLGVLRAELPESVLAVWLSNQAERTVRLEESLVSMLEARVSQALCLRPEEREEIRDALLRAGQEQLGKQLIGQVQNYWYGNEMPDPFRDLMESAKLSESLSEARAKLLDELVRTGRTTYHDFCFEAEYWLYGKGDHGVLRPLLYGSADALLRRSGRMPSQLTYAFEVSKGATNSKDWEKILRGMLDLPDDEDFESVPIRNQEEYKMARATFFLNVIDQRTVFSKDQREALAPLLLEFVEKEVQSASRYSPLKPELPGTFGIAADGVYRPSLASSNQLSTDLKSKLTALRDACSQQQLDVLDV